MKTTVKTNYSLKEEGYNENDRLFEQKEIRNVTGDKAATLKIIDDNTLLYEYNSDKNNDWYFKNFEDCTFVHEK